MIAGTFLYQKNRNKVLSDRISEQNNLLKETKDVVMQQSTAITSQKTVVDTAIKYSECFDPEKIQNITRREVELEKNFELENIKKEYRETISRTHVKHTDSIETIIRVTMEATSDMIKKLVSPLYFSYVVALMNIPKEERNKLIEDIEDDFLKKQVVALIDRVENKLLSNKA